MQHTAILVAFLIGGTLGCGSDIIRRGDDDDGGIGAGGAGAGGAPGNELGLDGDRILAVSTNIAPALPFIANVTISG